MFDLISSNIIERHQAFDALITNPMGLYPAGVILLGLICWRLKEWL